MFTFLNTNSANVNCAYPIIKETIPPSSLGYHTNNRFPNFPPIMADGRNFAKWQPGAVINQQIRNDNNIKSNWQYRQYLTTNADSIIKSNQLEACDESCYCPALRTGEQISNSTHRKTIAIYTTQSYARGHRCPK
jgi:hypothetical protein